LYAEIGLLYSGDFLAFGFDIDHFSSFIGSVSKCKVRQSDCFPRFVILQLHSIEELSGRKFYPVRRSPFGSRF